MTEVNPRNYPGANATIVGIAGGPMTVREFGNGGSQAQISIAVGKGYKDKQTGEWKDTGTDWYTLVGASDYASENWPNVDKGDTVRVDNSRLEARTYLDKEGQPKVDLQLRFGTLVVVQTKAERQANSGGGGGGGNYSEPTPF